MAKTKRGCVRRLLALVAGCAVAIAIVVAATNAAVVLASRDFITDDVARAADMLRHADDSADAGQGTGRGADWGAGGEASVDAIVVLGASVLPSGQPSGILRDRLDCGVALYFAGVAPKIIMSGDNGTATYNEVAAMKRYAVEQGVPSEDVFCDHAGFSTYESMYRARYVFGCERIVVATQTYHLYRAVYVARELGMQAVGVASDYHTYGGQLWFSTREALARTKDFFKAVVKPASTFVGEPISLAQSGDVTNG